MTRLEAETNQKYNNLLTLWNSLVGETDELVPQHRLVNAVCIITLGLLVIMLGVNLAINLFIVSIINICLAGVTIFFYYRSRVKGKYTSVMESYGYVSYIALIVNYHFNGGINGPTLFIFFLTFQMLVAITPQRQHLIWAILHVSIALILAIVEKALPVWVPAVYQTEQERFVDIIFTYIIVLVFIYFITISLKNSYNREKKLAEQHLNSIEEQNRKLESLSREKDKLFSIISHDMRSPLSTIQGYLELIAQGSLGDEEDQVKKELLNMTKQTSDMLVNMLAWQQSQMQGVDVILSRIEINQLIKEILEVQGSIAVKKNIQVNFMFHEPVFATADTNMLQLVIRNVINNAIKFTPKKGSIYISTYTENDTCCISIKDTGIGIPAEKHSSIFTLNAKTTYGTANEKGTGMGLSLSKEFIELQQGKIQFVSNHNEGTEFIITLPEAK